MRHQFQENLEHLACSKLKSLMACITFCLYMSGNVTVLFLKSVPHRIRNAKKIDFEF